MTASLRIALIFSALAILLAGCGASKSAEPQGSQAPAASVPSAAPDPQLTVPDDEAQIALWVGANVALYKDAFRSCEDLVNTSSANFDPSGVDERRNELVAEARATGEQAAFVAYQGCMDGTAGTPYPIPELRDFEPAF